MQKITLLKKPSMRYIQMQSYKNIIYTRDIRTLPGDIGAKLPRFLKEIQLHRFTANRDDYTDTRQDVKAKELKLLTDVFKALNLESLFDNRLCLEINTSGRLNLCYYNGEKTLPLVYLDQKTIINPNAQNTISYIESFFGISSQKKLLTIAESNEQGTISIPDLIKKIESLRATPLEKQIACVLLMKRFVAPEIEARLSASYTG